MKTTILWRHKAIAALALYMIAALPTFGQEHDRFGGWCDRLQNADSPTLSHFLAEVAPDDKNSGCVAWAIRKLGKERYEAAVGPLVRLLDFRRPPTERERLGFTNPGGLEGVWDLFPAVGALELIGEKSLPAILNAMTAESSSLTARENAVAVWMEIYRQRDEHPKAISLLRRAETNARAITAKQKLRWAVQKALIWCNPPEETACRQAATRSD